VDHKRSCLGLLAGCLWLGAIAPAPAADLGHGESMPAGWEFSLTPYGWMINVNGDVTARGNTVEVNQNFFQIVEKSDSLLAWMSYFEARKGKLALFTDLVWLDLGPRQDRCARKSVRTVSTGGGERRRQGSARLRIDHRSAGCRL
jgi:hypothetical protein